MYCFLTPQLMEVFPSMETNMPKYMVHILVSLKLSLWHTALEIYMLDSEFPETVIEGQASDISNICEFSWYQWVMFRDGPVQYTAYNLVLGRHLGPARDVGPARTAKVLKANGEVFPRYILRALKL